MEKSFTDELTANQKNYMKIDAPKLIKALPNVVLVAWATRAYFKCNAYCGRDYTPQRELLLNLMNLWNYHIGHLSAPVHREMLEKYNNILARELSKHNILRTINGNWPVEYIHCDARQ